MNKFKIAFIILIGIIFFSGCEKDDICVEGDTPLLVIRFYNETDTTNTKNVTNLRVVGLEQNTTVNTFSDRSTADSLAVPLRLGTTSTTYLLIANSADENEVEIGNTDTLTIDHETKEVFISRACGFIANYENITPSVDTDTNNWIKNIEVISSTIENSDSAHVKIYH